jgi:5'-nucleotidase
MNKPLILVTNDDGITSKGILNLVNVMKELGDVLVVAPDGPQSQVWGMPLR